MLREVFVNRWLSVRGLMLLFVDLGNFWGVLIWRFCSRSEGWIEL